MSFSFKSFIHVRKRFNTWASYECNGWRAHFQDTANFDFVIVRKRSCASHLAQSY